MKTQEDLVLCVTCGTQYDHDITDEKRPRACRICDDPRQYVPPTGQAWTCLRQMRDNYQNKWKQDDVEQRMWSIWTEPKFAIGQRCVLLETPYGNVLWDCIAYLDQETVSFIKEKGGLSAIVISHPHYYTTHLDWARTFDCPVIIAKDDEEWVNRVDRENRRKWLVDAQEAIVDGVVAVKVGGHFPGSLVLNWDKKLFIADSIVTVPSALYHVNRLPGTTSYVFMWSIPNMIPLPPSALLKMWKALRPLDFNSTHGALVGTEVRDSRVKERVLESMKIQARSEGWDDVAILAETL